MVSAGLVSSEAFPWLTDGTFFLGPHVVAPQSVSSVS